MEKMKGTIIKVFGRYYTVEGDGRRVDSVLRGRLEVPEDTRVYSNPAAVGDLVDYHIRDDGLGVIESVHKRRNVFMRQDSVHSRADIIACNLDQVVAVQSFGIPEFNLRFFDRILVRGVKENIHVLLCVNKVDLVMKGEKEYIESYYKGTGLEIKFVSAYSGEGMEFLKKSIAGKRSLLVGSSGVGKSSIFNRLYPGLDLKVNEVSESTGKGRHTTTNVSMIKSGDSTELIDTPGMREFGLADIDTDELGNYFEDFREAAQHCRFRPCQHDHEPGCEVKRLVEEGTIHPDRHISYLNILYSIQESLRNQY